MKPEELRKLQAEIEKKYESASPEELRKLVAKAYSNLREANEFFEKLTSQPLHTGIVLNSPEEGSVDVVSNGKIMNVKINPDIEEEDLAPGTSVNLLQESGAVFGIREPIGSNVLAYVEEVLSDGNVVVDVGGRKQALMTLVPVKSGERVAVDPSLNVVLESYGKQTKLYSLEKVNPVPWEKIGGLEKAISEIREAIEDPFVHAKIHRKYGSIPPKGILLYGPPGCGKTLIAKAIAYNLSQRLAKQGKANGNGNFFSIKGPELKNPYYGTSESLIRMLFTNARESAEHTGDLSMIFIDEAESLFGRRGQALKNIDDSLVNQFLAEMDGMEDSTNVMVVLATNRPDILDSGLRQGRIDRRIRIGRPDSSGVYEIFNIHLQGKPVYKTPEEYSTTKALAKYARDKLFTDRFPMFKVHFKGGDYEEVHMCQLTSGAMIESISRRAVKKAIRGEISSGREGLTPDDLLLALRDEYYELRDTAKFEEDDLMAIFPGRYPSFAGYEKFSRAEDGN